MEADSQQNRFERMRTEWQSLQGHLRGAAVERWEAEFRGMEQAHAALQDQGLWIIGPSDLISVLGRHGDELAHSAIVAWLLDPIRTHGLRRALIESLWNHLWRDRPPPPGRVRVELERWDSVDMATRADILVWVGDALVVIENKVWSPEGVDQCERLFERWEGQRDDVRFILLSPSGDAPITATSENARSAWTSLSYRDLVRLVEEVAADSPALDEVAESTVRQYVSTVRRYLT